MSLTPEICQQIIEKLGTQHIMLSYNWGVQTLVTATYEYIHSKGIPVWMDIKGGIHGNINAAMAAGVESAVVICPFMTEAYQQSESCELELNYAKDIKVPIVPCMVQERAADGSAYRAKGWLGVITAGKLWLDFRNTEENQALLAERIDQLLVEIATKMEIDTKPGFSPAKPKPAPAPAVTPQSAPTPAAQPAPRPAPQSQPAPAKHPTGQRSIAATWQTLSGALTRVGQGEGGLWGVNSNEDIFEWAGHGWKHISGKLVHVSVGKSVWGVNNGDQIYKYQGNNNWECISGLLTNIDVSNNDHIWGVNRGEQIFRRDGNSWDHLDGAAVQVSVGEAGVWVVNSGDNIYYREGTYGDQNTRGTGWTHIGGKLKWIASGENMVVGVNGNDDIFYRKGMSPSNPTGTDWVHVGGKLSQIDIHGDFVFGRNADMAIFKSPIAVASPSSVAQRAITAKWQHLDGLLTRVGHGEGGLWGVNHNEDIFEWAGHGWKHISGKLVHVSVGKSVWGVNNGDQIYKYQGNNNWECISGLLTNIDVSNNDHIWGVNRGEQIFRRDGNSWDHLDGAAVQVSVGEAGVWVVNSGDNIYYREGTYGDQNTRGTGWTHIGGKLKWIASGVNMVVGVNSNDDIFYRKGMSPDKPTGTDWVHVGGKLSQIDIHGDFVFGRNADKAIFKSPVA